MPKKTGSQSAVIVEIGSDWLKVAQVDPSKGRVAISRLALQQVGASDARVASVLGDVFKKQKFAKSPIIACIPRQAVTIRMLELPSTDPEEIKDMVELQIGKQTPYSKDEITYAYRIVGSGRSGYMRVMLAIVQRATLRQRFHILEEAGLDVQQMTVSTEGLLNWIEVVAGAGQTMAVLDMDSSCSACLVYGPEGLVFTRSILIGANQLAEDSEKWSAKLAQEVVQSIEMCRGEAPDTNVSRLVVTGAAARIPGLAELIGEKTELETSAMDALDAVQKAPSSPAKDDPAFEIQSLTAIVGIGLDPARLEFHLVPDSVRLRADLTDKAKALTTLGMLTMTALLSASLAMTLRLFRVSGRLHNLQDGNKAEEQVVQEVARQRLLIKLANERTDAKVTAANVMASLLSSGEKPILPEDVYLESVAMNLRSGETRVDISGTAPSRPVVLELMKTMDASDLFTDVRDDGIDRDRKTGRYKFKIFCALEEEE